MRFVPQGYWYLVLGLALAFVVGKAIHLLPAIIIAFLAIGLFLFFRDPERIIPEDQHVVVAVADGKVMDVSDKDEPKFLKQKCVRVVTFLSPFDVHVNRSPVEGIVKLNEHVFGKFAPAFLPHSEKNERQYIGIQGHVPALVVLLVGTVARRIESWVSVDRFIQRGERIGIMKFGSRADLYLPKNKVAKILVKKGDRVKAGETIIATLKG